jgi:hypothetical protein
MAVAFMASLATAVPDGAPELGHLRAISADLKFLMGENDLPLRLQARIAQKGYTTMALFSVMAAGRPELEALAKRSFLLAADAVGLTPDQVDLVEISTTKLVAAWMEAKQRFEEHNKLNSASRASNLPMIIPKSVLVGLRGRFEALHGRISDKIFPCAHVIELRLEEVEEGTLSATPLEEVICVELGQDSFSSDNVSIHGVRFRKAPKAIAAPKNTEELRTRFKTLAIAFVLSSFKHTSTLWLRTVSMEIFAEYVEYLLSEHVAGYLLDQDELNVKATWTTVLGYDLAMRKHMVRSITYPPHLDFAAALRLAMLDPVVRERHFITPTALLTAAAAGSRKRPQPDTERGEGHKKPKGAKRKGDGKGKKGKAEKEDKGDQEAAWLAKKISHTPDKKPICGFYNRARGCTRDGCTWIHICNRCLGAHPATSPGCPLRKGAEVEAEL